MGSPKPTEVRQHQVWFNKNWSTKVTKKDGSYRGDLLVEGVCQPHIVFKDNEGTCSIDYSSFVLGDGFIDNGGPWSFVGFSDNLGPSWRAVKFGSKWRYAGADHEVLKECGSEVHEVIYTDEIMYGFSWNGYLCTPGQFLNGSFVEVGSIVQASKPDIICPNKWCGKQNDFDKKTCWNCCGKL